MASDALPVDYNVRRSDDGLANRRDLQRTQKLAESFNLLFTVVHAVHDLPKVLVIVVLGPPLWHRRCTHTICLRPCPPKSITVYRDAMDVVQPLIDTLAAPVLNNDKSKAMILAHELIWPKQCA